MTDSPDVERLNRIRAALHAAINDEENPAPGGYRTGLRRALEIVERVWEPFYEGKAEDRMAAGEAPKGTPETPLALGGARHPETK